MSVSEIRDNLIATLGNKAVAYRAVTKYLCTAQLGTAKVSSDLGLI
jgi:hypothetical protein